MPLLAYLTCALVWGSTYFAIALGLDSFTPYGLVATRFTIGGFLALSLGFLRKEPALRKTDWPHLMLVGALLLAGSNALVSWAELHVSSGMAAILCALVPVFLVLFSGESIGLRAWAGLVLGLMGVGVLVNPLAGRIHLGGVGALLLATMIWSFGTLHGKHHIKGDAYLKQVGVEMLTAGAIGLFVAPLSGGYLHHALTLKAALSVGYLALFGSLIAFTAYIYLARVWSPAKMGTYTYINPVVALLLGCLFLKEPFNARMVLGMIVILAGVALVQLKPQGPALVAEEVS
ncbi:MAG: EamA family transporter [Acidobacteriota bacterium]|nr:EamA family transporter [Acidobacteriota bacterium]